jgi:hypothetical protein
MSGSAATFRAEQVKKEKRNQKTSGLQGAYRVEGWYCVHIAHERLLNAIDVTFRHMLLSEYRGLGQPPDSGSIVG